MLSTAVLLNELYSAIRKLQGKPGLLREEILVNSAAETTHSFQGHTETEANMTAAPVSSAWVDNQLGVLRVSFDDADKDKSGNLTFPEVLDVLRKSGFVGSDEHAKIIFRFLDKDKNSSISRQEYLDAMGKVPRIEMKEMALRRAFKKLDKDNSGFLTRDEIIDATKTEAGLDVSAEKISDLLIYLVKEDADQKVDYREFLHVFEIRSAGNVMQELFRKIDTDGSGTLSKNELIAAIKSDQELELKAEKISKLLLKWCQGDDKQVKYDDFVKVFQEQSREEFSNI